MEREMSFMQHLTELRKYIVRSMLGLILGVIVAFYFYEPLVVILSEPFKLLQQDGSKELYVNSIFEGFIIKIKISVLCGFIITFPLHLTHIILFILPALTVKERKIIFIFLGLSFVMIVGSVFYAYSEIIPISITFLTSAGFIPENVGLLLNYGSNIFFIFQFLIASLILFQIPLLLIILMMLNVLQRSTLMGYHRYIVVFILGLSAIITPPDPASLLGMAVPLVFFFYLSILVAKILKFGEKK